MGSDNNSMMMMHLDGLGLCMSRHCLRACVVAALFDYTAVAEVVQSCLSVLQQPRTGTAVLAGVA